MDSKNIRNLVICAMLAAVITYVMRLPDMKGWALISSATLYSISIFVFCYRLIQIHPESDEDKMGSEVLAGFFALGVACLLTGLTYALAIQVGNGVFIAAIALLAINNSFIFDLFSREYEKQKRTLP